MIFFPPRYAYWISFIPELISASPGVVATSSLGSTFYPLLLYSSLLSLTHIFSGVFIASLSPLFPCLSPLAVEVLFIVIIIAVVVLLFVMLLCCCCCVCCIACANRRRRWVSVCVCIITCGKLKLPLQLLHPVLIDHWWVLIGNTIPSIPFEK